RPPPSDMPIPAHSSLHDPATTDLSTLSLHDALPISARVPARAGTRGPPASPPPGRAPRVAAPLGCGPRPLRAKLLPHVLHGLGGDRKSTRLNSSHGSISYAVFCLKKKKPTRRKSPTH